MKFFPNLKIGFWNAWIPMLYFPLHPLIMIVIDKIVGTGDMIKKMSDVPYRKGEKSLFIASLIIILLMIVYAVFLPLKFNSVWFYVGCLIYMIGMLLFLIAVVNIATTPLGKPFTKGLYRFSRHPMVLAELTTFLGVGFAAASLLFIILTVILFFMENILLAAEERGCLERFGSDYQDYQEKTSRWVGLSKMR